jgi:hypothetical protein
MKTRKILACVRTKSSIPFIRKSEYALLTEDNCKKIKQFITNFEHTKHNCCVLIGGILASKCYVASWNQIEKYY